MSDADEERLREEVVLVCRRLWERGLIAGPDGNVSVRLSGGRVLATPSGLSKGHLMAADLVILTEAGELLTGSRSPSSEIRMHLRIYARRPDVRAVVHAHPPTATGFAVAGEDFMHPVLPEVILQMGGVPLVPYETPGSEALAARFDPLLDRHDAFLMANHGATTTGPTLLLAHQRMESLEHAARILLVARTLGRVNGLTREQVRALGEPGSRAS
ncbi:MAG: Ribulose-5-phosphate 4-epimerase-related epimerase and aldolase [Gemmatimonadetes bacterium]|nr:Ribulose-5-phosphate 4-epimerase-related epimerase and aldolase [Gemmatimonadota bacterium]